jgi:hypothetical protein
VASIKYRYNRSPIPGEHQLYEHLLDRVNDESPEELIARFKSLFVDAVGYPDRQIALALDEIAVSADAREEFRFILNRCCHILINRWQARPQLQSAIPDLVQLFESTPSRSITELSRAKGARHVRSLVQDFTATEQYLTLQRLARVISGQLEEECYAGQRPLGVLIRRYPYLYEHCLLSEDSTQAHQRTVQQLQSQVQKQFEVDLSQYVTYRVRRSRIARQGGKAATTTMRVIDNPTLLSDRDLVASLNQFAGKVDGTHTYRDLAHSFVTHSRHTRTYQHFKRDLYDYILTSVDAGYGSRQFNQLLADQLESIMPDSHDKPLNDFLLVRTYSQLLNFLIVESVQQPQHFVFVDLISNLGPVLTIGLLLKIVLLCRKIRPYLERRFSILFSHYESCAQEAVQWLVQVLETLNVALSTNFGTVNLPTF